MRYVMLGAVFHLACATFAFAQGRGEFERCGSTTIDPDVAIAACTRLVDSGSLQGQRLARVLTDRGLQHYGKGNLDAALADYDKAIEANPALSLAYYARGLVFGDLGNYKAAVAEYTKAIGIEPDYPYFTNRAHAYQQLKDFRAAVADYTEAVRLKPEDSGSYFRRGNLYADMGERDAAIGDFRKAADTAADEITRTAYRGRLYHVQGRREDAATAYRSVIADPNVDADAKALFQAYLDQVLKP
jgi:tetratricopeptide (TPR) repeat protein